MKVCGRTSRRQRSAGLCRTRNPLNPRNRLPVQTGPGPADGSAAALPDGNVLVGWGIASNVSEFDPDGRLIYAGRAGTGIKLAELERLWRRLQPLATPKMPLDMPPPRDSRFGSPLTLSRVHWVRPELVAEVKYLTWTEDNLLRQVVYEGLREDKPAADVRRAVPYPKPTEPKRPASRAKRSRPG